MKLLSLNYRELDNPWTIQDLDSVVKEKKPSILFFMETKLHKNIMKRLKVNLGFDFLFTVDGIGRGGGLA